MTKTACLRGTVLTVILLILVAGGRRFVLQAHSNWLLLETLRHAAQPSFVLSAVRCREANQNEAAQSNPPAFRRPLRAAALALAIAGDCQTAVELLAPFEQLGNPYDGLLLADLFLLLERREAAINALRASGGGPFALGRATQPIITRDNPATLYWADLASESLTATDQLLTLAEFYGQIGRSDLAVRTLEKGLSAGDPRKVTYWISRGLLESIQGESAKAMATYRVGLRKFPNCVELLERLQDILVRENRYREALDVTVSLSAQNRHSSDWHLQGARLNALLGDLEGANAWLETAARQKSLPKWRFEFLAGNLFCDSRFFSEAFRHYNRSLELSGNHPLVLYRLALCQKIAGDSDSAIRNLELARKKAPELADLISILDLLARCYMEQEELVKARQLWKRLLQLMPTHARTLRQIQRLDPPASRIRE